MIAYPTSYDLMMYALSTICSRKIHFSLYHQKKIGTELHPKS